MPKRQKLPSSDAAGLLARIGVAVKTHRGRLGVTQEELAWRAGLHRTYLADIERGGRNVTLRSIANLARALQISVGRLLQHAGGVSAGRDSKQGAVGGILLVEDNPADIKLTLRAFKRANFPNPVRVVQDGQEALDYLFRKGSYSKHKDRHPQLVLLDLNLPLISGVEVLRQMKASKQLSSIPVVVLTVSQQDENIIECGRLGAANYIVKPLGFDNLAKVTPNLGLQWTLAQSPSK